MTDVKKALSKMKGWQDLILETNKKLKDLQDPRLKFFAYQKDGTLRYNTGIYYSNEIDKILSDAEDQSERICMACGVEKQNIEQTLCEACLLTLKREELTYFGLEVHPGKGIKESDIKKLPFYEFWKASAVGSTCAIFDGETYVYRHDWENFCKSFIKYGTHRYQGL